MTSELRHPVYVWRDACIAYGGLSIEGTDAEYKAAAVIEADREAVRAPLLAEIERLTIQLEVESEPSPYCPICGSCGEDGCCGPQRCLYPTTEQAAELAKWKEQRLLDHGRLLWREDVETHCPNADLCFEYSATVRCSPCAIKQSDAEGVEALSLNNVYQPEVARLNRELAKFKALAETLAGALDDHLPSIVKRSTLLPGERGNAVQLEVNLYKIADRAAALSEALREYKEARDV